jgi:hypothetical protein
VIDPDPDILGANHSPERRCKRFAVYEPSISNGKNVVSSKRGSNMHGRSESAGKECRYSCIGVDVVYSQIEDLTSYWCGQQVVRWESPHHSRQGWWCRRHERVCGYGIDHGVELIGGCGSVELRRRRRWLRLGWLRGRDGGRRDVLPRWHCACGGH